MARDFNTEEKVVGYYCAEERMKYRGTHGAFWGGLWGLLDGSGFFWVPGIGPTVVAGPLINWVVPASEKAVRFGSLSGMGASLCTLGVPEDCVVDYDSLLFAGKYLLVASGSPAAISRAKEAVKEAEPESVRQHVQTSNDVAWQSCSEGGAAVAV